MGFPKEVKAGVVVGEDVMKVLKYAKDNCFGMTEDDRGEEEEGKKGEGKGREEGEGWTLCVCVCVCVCVWTVATV